MKMTDKLDMLMSEKKVNKHQLSMELDIPYTTIVGYYDKGYANAKLGHLQKLSIYFGCTLDYLVDDDIEDRTGQNKMRPLFSERIDEKLRSNQLFRDVHDKLLDLDDSQIKLISTILDGIKNQDEK